MKIGETIDKMELVYVLREDSTRRFKELMNPARQFGIKGMELKIVRVRIVWEVTRGGLRPTW